MLTCCMHSIQWLHSLHSVYRDRHQLSAPAYVLHAGPVMARAMQHDEPGLQLYTSGLVVRAEVLAQW